ncbi:MAG TPA: Fe2+-dependent dioxygenase [bacterium]|nr:Fe2+-dependent dioxygenase [bacterium]
MLLQIQGVLDAEELAKVRGLLDKAEWADGKVTAGYQSALAKDNQQALQDNPAVQEAGEIILKALAQNPLFTSAALPRHVFPPLFNRYEGGQSFGIHVDNAIRQVPGTPHRLRTDVSCTLFLSEPGDYDGGELLVEDTYGAHAIKLPAGHLILYPATSLHQVKPVTRGARIASFFWVQSMVKDDGERTLLFDLDRAIQGVHRENPGSAGAIQLTGVYHNLVRKWAEL